ncbi:DUF6233 domain-containing protein [Streptomyces sp. NPDC002851]
MVTRRPGPHNCCTSPARRVVVQQAEQSLAQLDRWIADEERREAERLRGKEARPPVPDWVVEVDIDIGAQRHPVTVHVGGCPMAGARRHAVDRDQAVRAIGAGVEACSHCRPDTELGLLE